MRCDASVRFPVVQLCFPCAGTAAARLAGLTHVFTSGRAVQHWRSCCGVVAFCVVCISRPHGGAGVTMRRRSHPYMLYAYMTKCGTYVVYHKGRKWRYKSPAIRPGTKWGGRVW